MDREGNRVGVTITLNLLLGSGLMIPGTGILLNNQMDDFSIKPGTPNAYQLIGADANAIVPGKRPLSSSTDVRGVGSRRHDSWQPGRKLHHGDGAGKRRSTLSMA